MAQHVSLREKFFGCIAGAHIGSAMGAPVEGWSYERTENTYGTLDKFVPYEHYYNGWVREPGTTEDGIERQKLMITAIIQKQNRVDAEDVRKAWVQYIKPESAGMISEPFEGVLLSMAKSGIPARELGRYCDYAGLNSFSRSCHPIGLINAGDIENAKNDVFEVGQLYQTSNSRGLLWACVTAVAIAEATKPNATVDSVIGAIYNHCDADVVVKEIDRELKRTAHCQDFRELRKTFDPVYNVIGIPYYMSYANEVVTKAVCIFRMVQGDLKNALISAVNMGRDTDCVTAVAAGISGALSGASSLPEHYITQCDYATSLHQVSNSHRTIREHADGLYQAYLSRMKKLDVYTEQMAY